MMSVKCGMYHRAFVQLFQNRIDVKSIQNALKKYSRALSKVKIAKTNEHLIVFQLIVTFYPSSSKTIKIRKITKIEINTLLIAFL